MNKKPIRWIILVFLLVLLTSFVTGRTGLWALYRLDQECRQLEKSVRQEQWAIDSLEDVVIRLQSDPIYIERVIREELGYSRAGEVVVKFIDQ